jgi:hypothetical protein
MINNTIGDYFNGKQDVQICTNVSVTIWNDIINELYGDVIERQAISDIMIFTRRTYG